MLTLCLIVKNEEESLDKCLNNAKEFVDEIIIVDTGSTDKTKEISLKYTDRIFDFDWCDDFSKARNFSISKASNDWVLILDADEYIKIFDRDILLEFINNPDNEKKVGRIEIINIIEDSAGEKKYFERVNRLFNKNYFQYYGIIHEQIKMKNDEHYETKDIDISSEHIGYTKEVVNKTNKLKRNIDLLNNALKDNNDDSYIHYQLGKSYYMLKDYDQAVTYFENALKYDLDYRLEYVIDLIETYGYALINSGKYKEALSLEKFSKYYDAPDLYFLMGLIYMNNAKFSLAVDSFSRCTKFTKGKMEGITTYLPCYNMGIIYEVLGLKEQALECYSLCGKYSLALNRYSQLLK
ncbi:tetratricopeptide repeat protein [Clostridium sp. MSJ-11]|uniref:Tetratricopeptide repeat protein n=1 Tax=Clostridium mobile TaxID=2841512 RepID=A0ABS6ECZ0_9CLOT|nr:glycosyltransferase family 2 protein [Clostridium mobile]MBU5483062.1 tetratricopeptide repeat protein [Clostridium mobile]